VQLLQVFADELYSIWLEAGGDDQTLAVDSTDLHLDGGLVVDNEVLGSHDAMYM
jgi:hypothetical protein